MNQVQELLTRYLDDRESLSETDWETLIAELKKSPTLVAEFRDQLILDDYLAQKLALDRADFLSQVGQRVNDYDRQVADTFNQVRELRSLAEAELTQPSLKPAPSWWTWGTSAGIVTAAALVCVAVMWQIQWNQPVAVAVVEQVTGEVAVKVGGSNIQLEKGTELEASQEVTTGNDGSVEWKYADGTRIRLEANAKARLERHPEHEGKRVFLDKGSLWGDIAKQRGNRPMTFVTPHAEAKVLGTRFQLVVHEQDSELEVSHGIVDFSRVGSTESIRVEADRVSHIGPERMELEPIGWPRRDDDLVFKFTHIERADGSVARNPDSNVLRETPLLARGDVGVWQNRGLMLSGGSYHSAEAGEDLLKLFKDHDRRELTVEVVLAAEEMADMPMHGSGTILSLASKGDWGNFSLRTAEGQWIAMLRTETGEALQPLKWAIDSPADSRLHHVAWTYRDGEWKGYCDGEMFVVSNDVHGSFKNWIAGELTVGADEDASQPWRGVVFGFAIYRRVLSQEELQENARHARVVYEPFAE